MYGDCQWCRYVTIESLEGLRRPISSVGAIRRGDCDGREFFAAIDNPPGAISSVAHSRLSAIAIPNFISPARNSFNETSFSTFRGIDRNY
jgi:hypothetical protein